jgi:transposase
MHNMRERAAALLKIAEGMKAARVADHELLRRRDPDTIYTWLDRYQHEGLPGLVTRRGCGRKPAFPPVYQDKESAKEALLHVIRREPRCLGIEQTRLVSGEPVATTQ